MSKQNEQVSTVFAVVCYGQIIGIYSSADSAFMAQKDFISKNRPADIICKPLFD